MAKDESSEPERQQQPSLRKVLRRRWDEGKASGLAGPLDIMRILSEERRAYEDRSQRRS